jgi:16S rRNA (uracil1498-N3)-methyltransferase
MLFFLPEEGLKLIPWEEETSLSLRDVFRGQLSSDYPIASPFPDTLKTGLKTITLAIGPEGGFSVDEIEQARRHGFLSVSLGRRVLRVETASLAALAVVQYEIH